MAEVFQSNHPLVQHKLTLLRDVATEPKRFRELVREVTWLLLYEATEDLIPVERAITTPMGDTTGQVLAEQIAFAPILPRRSKNRYDSGMGDPRIFLYLMEEARKRGMVQNMEAPSSACIADFRAKFIFDADGSIIPCPSLQGGEMAYGHVTTGVDFVAEARLLTERLSQKCHKRSHLLQNLYDIHTQPDRRGGIRHR